MGNYDKVGVERERYADMFTYDEPAGRRGKFFAGVTAPVIFIRSFAPDHDDSGLRIFVCNSSGITNDLLLSFANQESQQPTELMMIANMPNTNTVIHNCIIRSFASTIALPFGLKRKKPETTTMAIPKS